MSFDFVNNGNYRNPGLNSQFGAPVPNQNIINGYGIPTQVQQNIQQPQQQQYQLYLHSLKM